MVSLLVLWSVFDKWRICFAYSSIVCWSLCISRGSSLFWTLVYLKGSYVIIYVRGPWSDFEYLGDHPSVFYNFLHEVRAPSGCKSDRARFLKINLEGSQMGEKPHFGGFFYNFISLHPVVKMSWNFTYVISSTLSTTLRKWYVEEKSGFGCTGETRPLFLRIFSAFLAFFTLCQ